MDFRNKTDESGNIIRNKVRLVAQGYNQIECIDVDETFAPVAKLESVRLLLAMSCDMHFKLFQLDVIKSAFLNGILSEELYVEQPKGFIDPIHPDYVFRLKKALYGLKQAPRAWYDKKGFILGGADKTLFIKSENDIITIAQVYVNGIIFGSTSDGNTKLFDDLMRNEFEMSMVGELTYFLGLQVKQFTNGIFISQTKYVKGLVKKFGLEHSKHVATPISTTCKLSKDKSGKYVDHTLYRSMIGSLLYLTASRPDIILCVCQCARYQAGPKESHMIAVKRIIRYITGTLYFGI